MVGSNLEKIDSCSSLGSPIACPQKPLISAVWRVKGNKDGVIGVYLTPVLLTFTSEKCEELWNIARTSGQARG